MKILVPLVILLLMAGCQHRPVEADMIYFPQMPSPQPGAEEIMLLASGSGYLVIDRGCVRLKSSASGKMSTLFWHRRFELVNHGASVAVRDTVAGNIYPIGDHIRIGGGQLTKSSAIRIDPIAVKKCGGNSFGSAWIPEQSSL